MDQEKKEWMDEVGIKKFKTPVTHYLINGQALYTKEYLEKTPVEVLEERLNVKREINDRESLKIRCSEKEEWLIEMGMKSLPEPHMYFIGSNHLYSRDYIERTPLEKLKAKFDKRLVGNETLMVDDSVIKVEENS